LDLPFKFFSFLGTEDFPLLAFPLVYWCISRQYGSRLTAFFFILKKSV
jgi:hypothetical protein